jgi:hypothetical protein
MVMKEHDKVAFRLSFVLARRVLKSRLFSRTGVVTKTATKSQRTELNKTVVQQKYDLKKMFKSTRRSGVLLTSQVL